MQGSIRLIAFVLLGALTTAPLAATTCEVMCVRSIAVPQPESSNATAGQDGCHSAVPQAAAESTTVTITALPHAGCRHERPVTPFVFTAKAAANDLAIPAPLILPAASAINAPSTMTRPRVAHAPPGAHPPAIAPLRI